MAGFNGRRSIRFYLAIVILVSTGMLVLAAWQKSFWYDEAFSAAAAGRGLDTVLQTAAEDVHPPLLVYLLGIWGQLFGYEELGLRSLSILFAVLSLLLTFLLAKELLGERVALASVVVLGLAPLFIMFAHNARYYALSACLALIVTFAMLRHQTTGRLRYLLLYGLASIAFLYLLYNAAIVILLCNVWWLVLWSRDRPRSPDYLVVWLLAQVAVFLAYLPGLGLLLQTMGRISDSTLVAEWAIELSKRLGYAAYVFGVGETVSPLSPVAWLGLGVVGGLFLWAVVANRSKSGFWLATSFFAGILGLNGILSLNSVVSLTWQSLPVRVFYALPYLAICLGAGLAALRRRMALVAGVLLLLVYGVASWNYFTDRQFLRPMIAVPWRQLFEQIEQNAQAEPSIICGRGDYACKYYAERYGYVPHTASQYTQLAQRGNGEIWWIQTNLGRGNAGDENEQAILQAALERQPEVKIVNYAPQDASIRWLKSRFMGQEDYAYRVQVYQFSLP
jgi:uncharacterized membrane protein